MYIYIYIHHIYTARAQGKCGTTSPSAWKALRHPLSPSPLPSLIHGRSTLDSTHCNQKPNKQVVKKGRKEMRKTKKAFHTPENKCSTACFFNRVPFEMLRSRLNRKGWNLMKIALVVLDASRI